MANDLVSVPAVHLGAWMESFRPMREKFLAPLAVVYRDGKRRETERSLATDILADYAADQPEVLADLLMYADEKQFAVLYPKIVDHGQRTLTLLHGEVDKRLFPEANEDTKEMLAKRQANAAIALLRMSKPEKVWLLLKHSPDPRVRTYLIHRFGPLGVDSRALVQRLEEEPDVTIGRALVLSLGESGEKGFAPAERELVLEKLHELYRNAPDPGLRGAAEWLLRQWKHDQWLNKIDDERSKDMHQREQRLERIRYELAKERGAAKPQWYVNGQGQTMVVVAGPVEFLMGSPSTEAGRESDGKYRTDEQLHLQRIGQTFALATKPVTVEQFRRFRKDYEPHLRYAPTVDCPAITVDWYSAAEYCNWLSKQENLPEKEWCYHPNNDGKYGEGMKLVPDYLKRIGYRLPTEAEWEYACRAGTVTSRYYGDSEELLEKYAWYLNNSGGRSWPVGSLKPNDWGLFDVIGNVWEWCQEDVLSQERFVLRGAAYNNPAKTLRSAYHTRLVPTVTLAIVGFRPARTFR